MNLLRALFRRPTSPAAGRRVAPASFRPMVEGLEERAVPSASRVSAASAADSAVAAPYAEPAPTSNNFAYIAAQSTAQLQAMDFNTPGQYKVYVRLFHNELRSWVAQADAAGIVSDQSLSRFLGLKMREEFPQVRRILEDMYPGQTLETYRLLMAMNLADAYFTYATIPDVPRSFEQTVHLKDGNCTELADLLLGLVRAEGIGAHELGQSYNYETPLGNFQAAHVVVYADGLWLDPEINTAFKVDLDHIRAIAPAARLQTLLDSDRVFGFYNWYLQPEVRESQLVRGQDGGILSFYYQYYFAGIGQGQTELYFVSSD